MFDNWTQILVDLLEGEFERNGKKEKFFPCRQRLWPCCD